MKKVFLVFSIIAGALAARKAIKALLQGEPDEKHIAELENALRGGWQHRR
jgi:hypothetical protein